MSKTEYALPSASDLKSIDLSFFQQQKGLPKCAIMYQDSINPDKLKLFKSRQRKLANQFLEEI